MAKKKSRQPAAPKFAIEPLGNNVLVRRVDPEAVTPGGIIIPTKAQDKTREGIVVAVGPGTYSDDLADYLEPPVKVGDRVIFAGYGHEVQAVPGDGEHLLLDAGNVLAIRHP